jgi:putative transposase
VKSLKGRSSNLLQDEFPELKKRYWGNHFWAVGYGAWSTGNVTEEIIQKYIAGHSDSPNDKALILE